MSTPTNGIPIPAQPTCAYCEDTNINKKCIKCQNFYCILHTSHISPNLCHGCFKGLQVIIDEHFTKTVEVYNEATDTVRTVKSEARQVRLDGPDYVWYSVIIQQATDQELMEVLEFHKFMVSLIENQRDVRKVEKIQKLRGEGPVLSTITETRTSKKTKIKQQKTPREILAMSGITETTPGFDLLLKQLEEAAKK